MYLNSNPLTCFSEGVANVMPVIAAEFSFRKLHYLNLFFKTF